MAKSFLDRWVGRLKASAREEIQETVRTVVLYAVAAVAALIAVVFLTIAAFWALAAELTPISAALIVAGFYIVVAAGVLIWASWSGESTAVAPPTPENKPVSEAYSSPADMPTKMGVDLDNVARTLSDAGFRTEALILSASSDILRQLTPLQFVGLVFVGSFLVGRRLGRR